MGVSYAAGSKDAAKQEMKVYPKIPFAMYPFASVRKSNLEADEKSGFDDDGMATKRCRESLRVTIQSLARREVPWQGKYKYTPMLTNREKIRIEWGDCDPAGIVYFPRYVEYFDRCTRALFERAGVVKRDMLKVYGIAGIPVVSVKSEFMVPSRYGEDVIVESTISKWGKSSFVVRHRLMKGEVMAVECFETRVWVVQVSEDPVKYEGRSIPTELKERFGAAS